MYEEQARDAINRTSNPEAAAVGLAILAVAEQLERLADAAIAARKDS